ncbi:MAG: winged helix-turn-helix domain-containing protein [Myxococcales bacterium]|nr:winged helix-turn-helix domain-containing protein [Myxococcales bacterium]
MPPSSSIRLRDGILHLAEGVMERGGQRTRLSSREQALLTRLVEAGGEPVSRDALASHLGPEVAPRAVDFAVRRLRRKIESDPSAPRHVLTRHGVGYAFVPEQLSVADHLPAGRRLPLPDGWVDLDAGLIRRAEHGEVALAGRELQVLQLLARRAPLPVSREVLAREVWGKRATSAVRYVDQVVHRLRTKLEVDRASPEVVVTIPRVGIVLRSAVRVGWRVPRPPAVVVGRDEVLGRVCAELTAPDCLVTLHGPAGIGKTTTALAVARTFAGSAAFVDLSGARSPAEVRSALAFALGIDQDLGESRPRLLAALRASRGALLLLDDAEGCVDALAQEVRHLRRHVAVRLLVTSRRPLQLAAEVVVPIPPLTLAPAALLFRRRAEARGAMLHEDDLVERVVSKLGGVPLAIELAACRLRALGLADLERHLDAPLTILHRPEGPGGRHDSLARALAGSWEGLSSADRQLLAGCMVLGASFAPQTAEQVLGGLLDDVVGGLQRLADAALLALDEHGRLVPSFAVRAFVTVRSEALVPQLLTRARERYVAWAVALGSDDPLRPPSPAEARAGWAELPGALELLERLVEEGTDRRVGPLLLWCEAMLRVAGFDGRGQAMTQRALERFAGNRRVFWARLLAVQSERSEATAVAVDALLRSVDASTHPEEHDVALAYAAYCTQGAVREAHAAACRERLQQPGVSELAEIHLSAALGWVAFRAGRSAEAWAWLEPALGRARAAERWWLVQRIAHNLAGLAIAERRFDDAETFLSMARDVWTEAGLPAEPLRFLDMLGLLRLEQGRLEEADEIHLSLRTRAATVGDRSTAATVGSRLGTTAGARGDFARAAMWFEEHRAHARALGRPGQENAAHLNLGIVALARGRLADAARHFGAAVSGFAAIDWTPHSAYSVVLLAEVEVEQGRWREARALLQEAVAPLEDARRTLWLGQAVALLGHVRARLGEEGAAAERDRGLGLLREVGASGPLVQALSRVGLAACDAGDLDAGRAAWQEAAAVARGNELAESSRGWQLLERLRRALGSHSKDA